MAFWNKTEKRSIEEKPTFGGVEITTNSALFGGMTVNEKTVMEIPTVEACVSLIANTIASLPIDLKQQNKDGSVEKIKKDDRHFLLNQENEENMSSRDLIKNMVKDYLLHGQAFAYKQNEHETVRGELKRTLKELNYLPAKNMEITKRYNDGIKHTDVEYQLTAFTGQYVGGNTHKTFKPNELLRVLNNPINAFEGEGLLVRGDKLFKQALAEIEHTNGIYERGALPLGILKTKARLNEKAINALRLAWQKLYGGVRNSAKTVILEEGMEYEKISMNPNEIQMNETMDRTESRICKLFGVPESMISSKANKYNSVEQNSLHFLKHTIAPILVALEQAFDRQLLTTREKKVKGYFFRFDVSELLRATEKERTEAIALGLEKGLLTINEAREKLDLPNIEKNVFMWGLNHVLYNPKTDDMKVPNMDGGTENKKKEVVANDEPKN
ncbi:phage portal protein [Bacillus paranthracis]|uniref:phage portal protein n=1 Tax=Bacillus paranthracis TaxID=2026186 RepID=UPI0008FDEFCC|nr:phage portal protein [Bacillus paranthracis]OJE29206.1 phage portal protein [Bacillus paranthracis]